MAVVSSHILNGVDGSHAGGIAVSLCAVGSTELVFETRMDDGGRLLLDVGDIDVDAEYELVFSTGAYWAGRVENDHGSRILEKVVVCFRMPASDGRYHVPLIVSPNSYSLWVSTEHG